MLYSQASKDMAPQSMSEFRNKLIEVAENVGRYGFSTRHINK